MKRYISLTSLQHAIFLLIAVFALAACRHKDLNTEYTIKTRINIGFDWREAPDADPEGMCVFFYPVNNPDLPVRRYDFRGRDGGEIEIPIGEYRLVCYNNDTERSQFRGHNQFYDHEAYTNPTSIFANLLGASGGRAPVATGTEGEIVYDNPDMIWGCATVDMNVTTRGVEYSDPTRKRSGPFRGGEVIGPRDIVLFPHEQVCRYSYEILDVKNLKNVSKMCASLSGMSPTMKVVGEENSSTNAIIPAPATASGPTTIRGDFLTFGDEFDARDGHKLVLYVWYSTGDKFYYTFDVGQQIHDAPDKRRVHIILRGLEFPQPINPEGGGFSPTVDGWDEHEEDLIM